MKQVLGAILLSIPFCLILAVSVASIGVVGTLIVFGVTGLMAGCIAAGITLLDT